jgi:Ribosomal protein S1
MENTTFETEMDMPTNPSETNDDSNIGETEIVSEEFTSSKSGEGAYEGEKTEFSETEIESDVSALKPKSEMMSAVNLDPDGDPSSLDGETETKPPPKKRGRPRKKAVESESPKTKDSPEKRVPHRHSKDKILTIGDELEAELETAKLDSDLLDLAESLNGYRILSGYIQGIERADSGASFAVIYYGSIKIIIPTKELIILPQNIDGRDPLHLMHNLLHKRLGAEVDFVVKGVDRQSNLAAASRAEAMSRKRKRYFYDTDRDGNYRIYEGVCAEARIVSTIRNGIFVEFFGVEAYIPLKDLSYQRWHDATEHYQTGERVVVKVLTLDKSDPENIQLNLSVKETGENPFDNAIKRYSRGNRYIGKTSMIISSGVIVALDGGVDCLCRFPERGRPPIGSRVTVKINGIDLETKRIWGAIVHVSPR